MRIEGKVRKETRETRTKIMVIVFRTITLTITTGVTIMK